MKLTGQPEVRIVNLEPMTVASAHGYGTSPEKTAWETLLEWVEKSGIDAKNARFFGFNNPGPSAGSPNYGYEQWVTVQKGTAGSDKVTIKEFGGGLYAVTRCRLIDIFQAWQDLVVWCEDSKYKIGGHNCLEESITPYGLSEADTIMDLYQPITE